MRTKFILLLLLLDGIVAQTYGQVKGGSKTAQDTIRVDSLKPATVTALMRPHIKGDTVEFNTAHMALPPNSVIEEMLRRLPGLQIGPDGTITYNGQKIQRLIVDGEDIFGNNPTIVTKNFDASKIARVEILDRKSDQAIFTGVDDGSRTKTLNLVLKESAKDGYFGKIEAGGDIQGYYNANVVAAAFRDKEQFTALGIAANTGIVNFSSDGTGASVNLMGANPDALGASAGTGIPRFDGAALHYGNVWPGAVNHLVSNYQYSHYYTEPTTSLQSQQIESDSVYGQKQLATSTNLLSSHWIYGTYDWAPNDKSALQLNFHFSNAEGTNQYTAQTSSSFNDTLVNTSLRTIRDRAGATTGGAQAAWRTQVGKQSGRMISMNGGIDKSDQETNGYLYTLTQFFQQSGMIQSIDTVDQRKQISSHSLRAGGGINFVQPLWKGSSFGMSYGNWYTGDDPLQATYNRGDGKYLAVVDSLTSHYRSQYTNQIVLLNLRGDIGHWRYVVGGDWTGYKYSQRDLMADTAFRLRYSTWTPRFMVNYSSNNSTFGDFTYRGLTQQPTIAQLTPAKNNNDPLHISVGNPDLKPVVNQEFNLNFRRMKAWIWNLGLHLMISKNSISTKTTTDSLGRQVSQAVNVNGSRTVDFNLGVDKRIFGLDLGLHGFGTYARTVDYVNADLSLNDAFTGGAVLSINKFVPDKYSLQVNANFSHFNQVSSINLNAPIQYWAQSHTGAITLYFIRGFELNTNVNYTWQENTSAFGGVTSVLLWNSYVNRNFLHNKLAARFQLNNILNANAGITRTNSANVNTQSSTNILGRYWMLSAIYHFDKKFKRK